MTQTNDLDCILNGAAVARLDDRAFLRITGSDATRWLNGMVTNSIQALQPGEGCYNFLLNAQGRIQGDCTIYREPAEGPATYLLETDSSQLEAISQLLDKFIIMDDVELISTTLYGLLVKGPAAFDALAIATLPSSSIPYAKPDPGILAGTSRMYAPAILSGRHAINLITRAQDGFEGEVWSTEANEIDTLMKKLVPAKAVEASPETLEAFRIYEGRPKFGVDIRDKDLPQETNQPHALHFNKGCYLGQEIVERIRSRGQVHRLLTQFTLEGDFPTELPTPLESNGKPAGEITSAAKIGDTIYALGYARREFLETKAPFSYPNGTATPRPASN